MDRQSIAQFRTATDFVTRQLAGNLSLRDRPRQPTAMRSLALLDELTARRQMLGWSVKELAQRCNVEESTIAECEQGGTPPLDLAERWATAVGLRIVLVPADGEARHGLKVDWQLRRVTVDGKAVRLTPMEWKALERLAQTPGEVVTHQALFYHLYGDERRYRVQSTAIRVLITKLRRLLPLRIEAQWGKGYVVSGLEPSLPPALVNRTSEPVAAPCLAPPSVTKQRFEHPSAEVAKHGLPRAIPPSMPPQVIAIDQPRMASGPTTPVPRSPCRSEELGVIERFLAERGVTRCPDVATIQQSPLPTLVWDKVKRKWVRPASPVREAG